MSRSTGSPPVSGSSPTYLVLVDETVTLDNLNYVPFWSMALDEGESIAVFLLLGHRRGDGATVGGGYTTGQFNVTRAAGGDAVLSDVSTPSQSNVYLASLAIQASVLGDTVTLSVKAGYTDAHTVHGELRVFGGSIL